MWNPLLVAREALRNAVDYALGPLGEAYQDFFGPGGYRDPAQLAEERVAMHRARPDCVSLHRLHPRSLEGRPLEVVRVRRPGLSEHAPRVLLAAQIHGREFIGGEVAMDALWELIKGTRPEAVALLERCEVDVLPLINPDGVWANVAIIRDEGSRFGPLKRTNARGVDLNRNFGAQYNNTRRAYRSRWSDEFSGRGAFSEPESRALKALVEERQYKAAINLHSYSSVFLYPRFSGEGSDPLVQRVAESLPQVQPYERYGVVQGGKFYRQTVIQDTLFQMARGTPWVHGTFDDWLDEQGARTLLIEVTTPGHLPSHAGELLLSQLRIFNPPPQERRRAVDNVLPAIYAFYHGILDGLEEEAVRLGDGPVKR